FCQAEDGIRDATVTGVQTCALPIYASACGMGWVLALFLACMPDDSVAQASTPMPQALAFARPTANGARNTHKIAPEESNAENEGAFAAPGSPVQFPEANSPPGKITKQMRR